MATAPTMSPTPGGTASTHTRSLYISPFLTENGTKREVVVQMVWFLV